MMKYKKEYFVKIENQDHGPLTLVEIKRLHEDGVLFSNSLVRDSNSFEYCALDKLLNPNSSEKIQSNISKKQIYIPTLIIVLLILLILNEYRFQALNDKIKSENVQSTLDSNSIQNDELKKMITEDRAKFEAVHSRVESFERTALQMSSDYKLIKATKDSIESLNNTVLQLKNSTEANNKMQIDALDKQVAKLQEKLEITVKEYNASNESIKNELKSEQRKLSLDLALLEANLKDANKKITNYEIFKEEVIKDLKYDRNILTELVKKTGLK